MGVWVPHTITPKQQNNRLEICMNLVTKKLHFNWLDNLITGVEKWVMYVNITGKRQWAGPGERQIPTPKPDLHPEKVMSVWWGVQGIAYWELLPVNMTITTTIIIKKYLNSKAKN